MTNHCQGVCIHADGPEPTSPHVKADASAAAVEVAMESFPASVLGPRACSVPCLLIMQVSGALGKTVLTDVRSNLTEQVPPVLPESLLMLLLW